MASSAQDGRGFGDRCSFLPISTLGRRKQAQTDSSQIIFCIGV